LSIKFVDKMARCVSVGCDKDDQQIKNQVTYKFPLDIKKVGVEFDEVAKLASST
jgi:hypothetical protein